MNRHSITGPVILIGAGFLLLLHNVSPGFSLPHLLSTYWPFGVILVGIAGLIEVLFHASRGSQIPPRPISSFVWLLVVFAALGLWGYRRNGVHIGRLEAGGINLLGSNYEYDVNASSEEKGITRVVFENLKGNLTVKGEDGNTVSVTGHRTVRAYSREDADRVNASSIKLERHGDSLVIHADLNNAALASRRRASTIETGADLDIIVPKGVSVETRDRSGDITMDDIRGTVDISNGRGDVRLNNIDKDVKIDSSRSGLVRATNLKGNLDLQGNGADVQVENVSGQVTVNGKYSGTLEFRAITKPVHFESDHTELRAASVPGSVVLDLGDLKVKNAVGPVRFQTTTRDVEIEDATNSIEVMLDRGDVQISPGKEVPKMDVHTRKGNISLALSEKAAFDLKANTEQGEIENDYGLPISTTVSGRSATAQGSVGKGSPIVMVTDRGTVSIKKQ